MLNITRLHRPKRGFTLIELLVVIAIIALLLSVIVPSLGKAKEHAKNMICQTNLKSLGAGFQMYLTVNNQRLIPYDYDNNSLWLRSIGYYLDNVDDVRFCPSAKKNLDKRLNDVKNGDGQLYAEYANEPWVMSIGVGSNHSYEMGSYTMNGWLYSGMNQYLTEEMKQFPYQSSVNINNSSNTPAFMDGYWVDTWPRNTNVVHRNNFSFDKIIWVGGISDFNMERVLPGRHKNKVNIVFMDGSTGPVEMKDMWTLSWHKGSKPNHDFKFP